MIYAFKLTL